MPDGERRLAAIMFTDIVGYTALAQRNESHAMRILEEHRRLVRPLVEGHGGREIKTIGDAFLVEFQSALDAVLCSVAIQQTMHDRALAKGEPLSLRIGIHVGDVIESGADILGDAVNVGSRIEQLAEPGGICISGQAYEQVRNKSDLRFISLGEKSLKNVESPVLVYSVQMPWERKAPPEVTAYPTNRIAILPFVSMSADPNDEYFADGLTEELTDKLCQLKELEVIARTSAMNYKRKDKNVSEIGKELKVGTLVEGSVRKAGSRIRVTAQLVNTRTEGHLWSSSYDREIVDVFAVQSDIAQKVAEALEISLVDADRLAIQKRPTKSIEAYESYLRGLQWIRSGGIQSLQEVVKCFETAIRLDPAFSTAYAELGNYYVLVSGETVPFREAFEKARPLIAKALELDDSSSDAHVAMGNLALQSRQDFQTAENEFREAIELNPSSASAHLWYGQLLRVTGNLTDALKETKRAQDLDPLSLLPKMWVVFILEMSGDLEGAIRLVQSSAEAQPDNAGVHASLAELYILAGNRERALIEANLSLKLGPELLQKLELAFVLALLGRGTEARELLKEVESSKFINHTELATVYIALGDKERALDLISDEFSENPNALLFYYQDPKFNSVRTNPRFVSLLEKLNLPK